MIHLGRPTALTQDDGEQTVGGIFGFGQSGEVFHILAERLD
ncbi:hypothetical protein ACFOHY_16905 [Rhizobium rosettiformans]